MGPPKPGAQGLDPGSNEASLEIRPLAGAAEYLACVQLQHLTWGRSFDGCVPASLLQVLVKVGALVAGAFTSDGVLAGFVFGVTGPRGGTLAHWSHMLAVRPELRDHGIGRRLKRFQRASLRRTGVREILWTYDPLVARNAHLNLNRLGARVVDFVPDMYGDTGSVLHRSGTDRFIVSWPVDDDPDVDSAMVGATGDGGGGHGARALPAVARRAPLVDEDVSALPTGAAAPRWLRVEIPPHIEQLQQGDAAAARAWRVSSRDAFERCFAAGMRPAGFFRDADERCFYVMARDGGLAG